MARKTIEVVIEDGGEQLTFTITQMSATKLYNWLCKLINLVSRGDIVPSSIADISGAINEKGIIPLIGSLAAEDAKPLRDELLACCSRRIGTVIEVCSENTLDGYVSDVQTIFKLLIEAGKLNLGFLSAEAAKLSASPAKDSTEQA